MSGQQDTPSPYDYKDINPVSYFNQECAQYALEYMRNRPLAHETGIDSFSYTTVKSLRKKPMIKLSAGQFICISDDNELGMKIGDIKDPFTIFCENKFKGNYHKTMWFIEFELKKKSVPYLRVGPKYFKLISKEDRNKVARKELKVWDKMTITDDYGKSFIDKIPVYDDFTLVPNNKEYDQTVGNHYNLYAPFEHTPAKSFKQEDIYWTMKLMKHIFGEQLQLGIKYVKTLYDLPTQKLPILVLTSEDRSTGKTTFIDFLELLFGANTVIINPQDISNSFNFNYASSNIIMIEESRFDSIQATEKLKNLATQKKILVNSKFVQQYSIPFHGKIIITSNDENKFSRVDDKEIRYWVRKVPLIEGKANHSILKDLKNEIPYFLAYLNSLPDIDTSKSRMVFEHDVLETEALKTVKKHSRSALYKELELLLDSHMQENIEIKYFEFIAKDLKEKWFRNNSKIEVNYIDFVLKSEMKLERQKMRRYKPLESSSTHSNKKSGTPYKLKNIYYGFDRPKEEKTFNASDLGEV